MRPYCRVRQARQAALRITILLYPGAILRRPRVMIVTPLLGYSSFSLSFPLFLIFCPHGALKLLTSCNYNSRIHCMQTSMIKFWVATIGH